MSDLKKDAPRRYLANGAGQRVLVGLTIEETIEFERLDNPAGSVLTNALVLRDGDIRAAQSERRWLELYGKHQQAWRDWMAGSRNRRPHVLN
jgi:hypothetical protein